MGSWWPPLMLSPFVICDALLGCGESWGWRARWHDLLWSFRSKHFGERPWVQLQAAALPWGFGMIWIWIVVCSWSHPKMIWNDLNKSLHHPKWKESFHKPSLSGKECWYFLRHMPRYTNVLRWIALSMLWGPTSLHGPSHSKRVKLPFSEAYKNVVHKYLNISYEFIWPHHPLVCQAAGAAGSAQANVCRRTVLWSCLSSSSGNPGLLPSAFRGDTAKVTKMFFSFFFKVPWGSYYCRCLALEDPAFIAGQHNALAVGSPLKCWNCETVEEYGFTKQAVVNAANRVMSGRPQEMSTRALGSSAIKGCVACVVVGLGATWGNPRKPWETMGNNGKPWETWVWDGLRMCERY